MVPTPAAECTPGYALLSLRPSSAAPRGRFIVRRLFSYHPLPPIAIESAAFPCHSSRFGIESPIMEREAQSAEIHKVPVSVRLSPRKIELLNQLAIRTGTTRNAHIQLAVAAYLEREK